MIVFCIQLNLGGLPELTAGLETNNLAVKACGSVSVATPPQTWKTFQPGGPNKRSRSQALN